jgi:hypothetical protein
MEGEDRLPSSSTLGRGEVGWRKYMEGEYWLLSSSTPGRGEVGKMG